jgi:hypothetical protein
MTMKLLSIAATLTLVTSAAFAASANNPADNQANTQTNTPQTTTEYSQTSSGFGTPTYRAGAPAYPGETAHVIGGQTFYFGNDVGPAGADGGGH